MESVVREFLAARSGTIPGMNGGGCSSCGYIRHAPTREFEPEPELDHDDGSLIREQRARARTRRTIAFNIYQVSVLMDNYGGLWWPIR